MRIGLISDTHGYLDPAVFTYFAECDEVWHAGDFGGIEVLRQLQAFKPVKAVYGNIDGAELRGEIPGQMDWECEGLRFHMVHQLPGKRELERIRPDVLVCGHSHILKVVRDAWTNALILNPGAAGRHGWHKVRTLLRFTAAGGRLAAAEAVELGPRSLGRAR